VAASAISANKRPLLFLRVGILNTFLDFGFYTFLTLVVFSREQVALAGLTSGTFALLCAFLTHGLITWRGSHLGHKTLLRFFLFTGFGMWIIRPLLLSLFIQLDILYEWVYEVMKLVGPVFSVEFITNTGAFGLMLLIVLAYNYFVYERFVFKVRFHRTETKNH
jgi:putative flippase GtrA